MKTMTATAMMGAFILIPNISAYIQQNLGYPREHIPWFPTISEALCTQCGACKDICARPVFDWDENGKIWVAEPFLCLVGCCFCKSVCEPKALFFPGQELLKNYPEKM